MKNQIIQISDDFWNIRGSFKIGGVVDIGTQASLVRLGNGNFVFLDSYEMSQEMQQNIDELMGAGGKIEAILNLHPFHTMHVERMHELYPDALLYGTARHVERFPALPWEKMRTEDVELHEWYADDLEFSVPCGVDFISDNENVHFSSVMVYHRASRTIHADDTLMYIVLPLPLRVLGMRDSLGFHPTLSLSLEKHAGAADDFRAWAEGIIDQWSEATSLCAAHSQVLLASKNRGASIKDRLLKALKRCDPRLRAHARRYG